MYIIIKYYEFMYDIYIEVNVIYVIFFIGIGL